MILDRIHGEQNGVSFLETAIALAIIGLVTVAFLSGLATASRAVMVADKQSIADSLARSQMDWVKNSAYVYSVTTYTSAPIPGSDNYVGYTVTIGAQALNSPDDGIQKITVTVQRNEQSIMTMEGYKVDR